jgi:hypothetical protein
VEIEFSRPGKPTDNADIEAFNIRLRAECLNASWFLSLADAQERLEVWRREYNEKRPRHWNTRLELAGHAPAPTPLTPGEDVDRPADHDLTADLTPDAKAASLNARQWPGKAHEAGRFRRDGARPNVSRPS